MKKIKLLVGVGAVVLAAGTLAGCGSTGDTVRLGLHTNYGAGAGYSAIQQGFFEAEGVKVEPSMGDGPSLAASLVAGKIDVSFMGNGVAWNYFTDRQNITLVALDNLTNDDKLIASTTGKGKDLTLDSPHEELAAALKGSEVLMDTSATPASFWSSLVNKLNESLEDGEKLWYKNVDGKAIPEGVEQIAANEVKVANASNSTVTASMQKGDYDFCVAFAPVSTTLLAQTDKFQAIATTATHMSESYTPSTWAVNTKWLENNKDLFARFMKGLVKGMNFRRDNQAQCAKDIEAVTAGSFKAEGAATDIAVWLGAKEQLELLDSGKAMKYVENIRNSQTSDEVSTTLKTEDAVDFSYLKAACEELL